MSRAIDLINLLNEVGTGGDGQEAGKLEIAKISMQQAIDFMDNKKFDWKELIPDFEKNFKIAQDRAKKGWTKREEMPVIEDEDVRKLQARLRKGNLDINKPFADDTNPKNPFPQGLSGFEAAEFLERGLKDGSIKDDQIDVDISTAIIKDLTPIQKQIYFDIAIGNTIKFGLKSSIDFVSNKSFFILSKDKRIIDGHHRFLTGMLINPDMKINALVIDLPIKKLLPLTISYSDALGHKRNK